MSQAGSASGGGGGSGTVTQFSFTNTNGFSGNVTNPTTTPNLTLSTSITNFNPVYANAGALVGAGVGTALQVFTSGGAGVAPSWSSNPGGWVVGPASSTATAIPSFADTTGKLIQDNPSLTISTTELLLSRSNGGAALDLRVNNLSNTASSSAYISVSSGGSSADDAYYRAIIAGTTNWTFGADNSDSDAFVVSNNLTLGTNNKVRWDTNGGQYGGYLTNTTPPAGCIGQQVRATVAAPGSSISNNTATNITSISLTAGIWDVSGIAMYAGVVTGTGCGVSISTASGSTGTRGDNYVLTPVVSTTVDSAISIPAYRIELSATTTVYLVGMSSFTAGTQTVYGRISATRVG